jgi:hypothetical protein
LPYHHHDSLFELLWPLGARCYVDIGHKIIFCTQVERALQRLGWRYAEPALRSLVHGLLAVDDSISGSELATFRRSRELATAFPAGWLRGHEDPERSAELLRKLRECDDAGAQRLVVAALREGLGPNTVWDGLRLYAAELFHRRPRTARRRHGPVHGVTEVNAFAHGWRTTNDETTKRLMILQAAGWLPLLRRDLTGFFGAPQGPGLDVLGAELDGDARTGEKMPGLGNLLEEPVPALARAQLDRQPRMAAPFLAELRRFLAHKAVQNHQYKYTAALHEEATRVHPRWASRLLAPAITYLPTAGDPDTEILARSRHALRQAGV